MGGGGGVNPFTARLQFCKVTLTLSVRTKFYDVTIQMKALCLHLLMVKFVFQNAQNESSKFGQNLLLAKFGRERVKNDFDLIQSYFQLHS